ncbi:hypothetical protein BCR35DRAFT_145016 [Leucosporidium creatinivorum]|uniref:Aminoglycoside phosphotransferase domain-containing protein n=1 Tax=Leucosporidium creatinivorum TaxID=106004 RepID=A0A1Y2ERB4_9BASI|nr:hypothetical protein BCR35DRAFT_145016 [Leucosporidium creatinivorum]
MVVKWGVEKIVTLDEGLAMEFAGTKIKEAPKFLGYNIKDGKGYLYMSYIAASLSPRLSGRSLTVSQCFDIVYSLKGIVEALRDTSLPANSRPVGDFRDLSAPLVSPTSEQPVPSFSTESEMITYLNNALLEEFPTDSALLRSTFNSIPTNHRLVFTHGDLPGRNLIVRDRKLVGLVDWGYSGWYPEYFETMQARQ